MGRSGGEKATTSSTRENPVELFRNVYGCNCLEVNFFLKERMSQ
jgi:hypothetical protein